MHAILEATTHGGDKELEKALFSHADAVTTKYFNDEIYYRGIVEFSNVCQNDCNYCGIRKHMHGVHRWESGAGPCCSSRGVGSWVWVDMARGTCKHSRTAGNRAQAVPVRRPAV